MDVVLVFSLLALVVSVIFVVLLMIGLLITSFLPNLTRHESEKYYTDPKHGGNRQPFPSIQDQPTLDLSVIVPAYNEQDRLPAMMNEAMEYLEQRQEKNKSFKYEIIIVDDGSTDSTTEVALMYSEKYGTETVRVLTLVKNRGKGGAVRMGMLGARGKRMLFADADGASTFADVAKLEAELEKINTTETDGNSGRTELFREEGIIVALCPLFQDAVIGQKTKVESMAVVCGSRAHLEKEAIATRSVFRTFLMLGFHFLVWFLCVRGVRDTQCGFKLFTRPAAKLLFYNLHVERWAFDVELLHIAQHFKLPVGEVAINWQEIEGSKVTPVWSWLQMGCDLLLIRLRYLTGLWTMHRKPKMD